MSKALKAAIEANDPAEVQKVIKRVKNLNRRLPGGDAPLLHACKKGADKIIDILLQAGAVGEKKDTFAGESPLAVAAEHGQVAVMDRLLAIGQASPEAIEHALMIALMDGRENVARCILDRVPLPITARHFRLAASPKSPEPIVKLLVERGGNINAAEDTSSDKGITPFHCVAHQGDAEKMRILARYGADVNARDPRGRTPLMYLAEELEWTERSESAAAAVNALATLLELGADAQLKDNFGNDAIAYLEISYACCEAGANERLLRMLQEAGASGSGATGRLFTAIRAKSLPDAAKAIHEGANVNHVMPHGGTPLIAVADETAAIAELLLNAGADPNKAGLNTTPLISAARGGDLQIVKLLIGAGADLHATEPGRAKDTNAYTAAEIARRFEVMDYLKKLGAGRPKPTTFKPFEAGIASWNDFSEVLVKADVATTAEALAELIQGAFHLGVYGQSFTPGSKAYVVVRPRGMQWSNVFQIAPSPDRFDSETMGRLSAEIAKAVRAPVLHLEYSDTADAASMRRYEPDGKVTRDTGCDRDLLEEMVDAMGAEAPVWAKQRLASMDENEPRSTDRAAEFAKTEKFVAAAFSFYCEPGRQIEIDVAGYPAEAFEGVAFVTT